MSTMTPKDYLMLPWSIVGPNQVTDEFGNRHYEMRVRELPDFMIAGETEAEVLYEFKKALLVHIESYVNDGEVPPHPTGEPIRYLIERKQKFVHLNATVSKNNSASAVRGVDAELVPQ